MENYKHITGHSAYYPGMDSKEQIYKELKANPEYVVIMGNRVSPEGEAFRSKFILPNNAALMDAKTYKKYIDAEDSFIMESVYSVNGTFLVKTSANDFVEEFDFTPVLDDQEEGTEKSY